ncbi:uncharacterized protein LOC102717487 isoform X1 [Oryza brachyantha]|nr:uncharacterized protein LOC102717487 isoform X1 [Oryza brachyantha]
MASDGPQWHFCQFCGKGFKRKSNWSEHEPLCKNKPDAQGGTDILNFHVPRRKRSALPEQHVMKADRPPEEETDVLDALLLLKEQPAYPGETEFSDDEPAANDLSQVLTACSDDRSSSVDCYGGDERRVNVHPNVVVETDDLSRNVGSRGVTNSVDDSDVIQKQKRKPDLSIADCRDLVEMQRQNMKADINIPGHKDSSAMQMQNETKTVKDGADINVPEHRVSSVMQMQNEKLDLSLLRHNNSSDNEVSTLSDSPMDDSNALVPTDTNLNKETKTVDIYIPEHIVSSVMQMQNEKPGLDLLPHNNSSDKEESTLSSSSMNYCSTLVPTDINSDKETKTVSGDQNAADVMGTFVVRYYRRRKKQLQNDQEASTVMHLQNEKPGLDLLPHNNSSHKEESTLSDSSVNDRNAADVRDTFVVRYYRRRKKQLQNDQEASTATWPATVPPGLSSESQNLFESAWITSRLKGLGC